MLLGRITLHGWHNKNNRLNDVGLFKINYFEISVHLKIHLSDTQTVISYTPKIYIMIDITKYVITDNMMHIMINNMKYIKRHTSNTKIYNYTS